MKYQEFRELITQINIEEIELDEVVKGTKARINRVLINGEIFHINDEADLLIHHLRNLATAFEARVNSQRTSLFFQQSSLGKARLSADIKGENDSKPNHDPE